MTDTQKAAEQAELAIQAPTDKAEEPRPASHEARATEKHKVEESANAPPSPPHKKYRSEPHHSILLENNNPTASKPVLSTSQYISDFLQSRTALSIIPESARGKIDVVNSSHGAGEALNKLSKDEILSVPVYDKQLEAYVGFVDYLDLASLVVDIVHKLMKEFYPDSTISSLEDEQLNRLVHEAKRQFNSKTLFDISDLSKNDPFMPILKSANLYQAIEILAKFGIHRVPITDDEQKIEAILSQSAVVKFLFDNLEKFSTKAKKSVADLLSNRETTTVLTITENTAAFEAFELMLKHRVSAVGVVDDSGVLVGVLSGTDLRIIGPHASTLSLLFRPVKEMLEQSRELNSELVVPVVKVTKSDTLGIAIENMEDNKVHRVFVVDDESKPICVLSMKDVLTEFLHV